MPIKSFIEEFVEETEPVMLICGKNRRRTTKASILSNEILSERTCKVGMLSGILAIYVGF